MFGMGMMEIGLILAIALIVIGPKKLPDIAKALGRAMGEFKKATNDLKDSINIDDPIDITYDSTNRDSSLDTYKRAELKNIAENVEEKTNSTDSDEEIVKEDKDND